MILDYLEKLRQEPPQKRQQVALLGAVLGTSFILFLWFGHRWIVGLVEESMVSQQPSNLLSDQLARVRLGVQFLVDQVRNLLNI